MADSYCGKNCDECESKQELDCQGCKCLGVWNSIEKCNIAECCLSNNHESCMTCVDKDSCETLVKKYTVPFDRKVKREAEKRNDIDKTDLAVKYIDQVLGLFWISIILLIPEILTMDYIDSDRVKAFGTLMNIGLQIAFDVILIRMGTKPGNRVEGFKLAGILDLFKPILDLAELLIFGLKDTPAWFLVFSLPVSVISLVAVYKFLMSFSELMSVFEFEISNKWSSLWKKSVIFYLIAIGAIPTAIISPIIGAVALIVSLIALLIISICRIIYMWTSAKILKNYINGNPDI